LYYTKQLLIDIYLECLKCWWRSPTEHFIAWLPRDKNWPLSNYKAPPLPIRRLPYHRSTWFTSS